MFNKILVPIDFSEYTDEILEYASEIAKKFGSSLHLIHVIPTMNYFTPYDPHSGRKRRGGAKDHRSRG